MSFAIMKRTPGQSPGSRGASDDGHVRSSRGVVDCIPKRSFVYVRWEVVDGSTVDAPHDYKHCLFWTTASSVGRGNEFLTVKNLIVERVAANSETVKFENRVRFGVDGIAGASSQGPRPRQLSGLWSDGHEYSTNLLATWILGPKVHLGYIKPRKRNETLNLYRANKISGPEFWSKKLIRTRTISPKSEYMPGVKVRPNRRPPAEGLILARAKIGTSVTLILVSQNIVLQADSLCPLPTEKQCGVKIGDNAKMTGLDAAVEHLWKLRRVGKKRAAKRVRAAADGADALEEGSEDTS
ncbi:hypothetical protein BV25DRAFT_1838306 [Artomyces pyxidatus]|uniref:Uncharacterized protein n=1 Tax=Artomyces pyxidatus TaxID=48021 RepID=A0ACB8T2Z4_9AGAM|nr:hypothetical protein BV25DRAFT_1838306 [Artomyces pyxidatus]